MSLKLVVAFLLSAIPAYVYAQKPTPQAAAKAIIPPVDLSRRVSLPVEKITLPNGLTVILSEDHSSPFVAVNVWYQVGAINEKANRTGLAHLFEHLMFEGSRHVKAGEHFNRLENAGASDTNASTNFDRTNYYQTVPKNQLELALKLESSRMFWLKIDQQRLDEQRAVVRREREQRLEATPYGDAAHQLWQAIFPKNHPFHGQVIGSHRDLEAAKLDDVQGFYDRFYGPSNASVALVGDFTRTQALALIEKYFGSMPKTSPIVPPKVLPVTLKNEEIIRVDEKLGKLPLVHLQYITPALLQPGDAEMDILAHILAGSESGRLTKAVTREKQLASSISAMQQSFGSLSVFTIDALLNPGVDDTEVIREIDVVLNGLISKPIESAEIERAQNFILTQQLFGLQNLGGYSGRAEIFQTYNRFAKRPDFLRDDILRYRKVNEDNLKSAARNYLPVGKGRKILIAKPVSSSVVRKGN